MRTIKFRAWDKERKEMYYSDFRIDFNGRIFWWKSEEGYEDWRHDDTVDLMQYTGIEDKNGKEIYEGDVIFIQDTYTETVDVGVGRVPVAQENDPHIVEVMFLGSAFGVRVTENKDTLESGWHAFTTLGEEIDIPNNLEVIGNIYENPELLNK